MRSTFASRFGTIAVVGGSVVGLGNIWRFPYIVGENGGAAFILVYIVVSLFIAIPVMLSEFALGRASRANVMGAFTVLSGNRRWEAIGVLGIATSFMILSFYSVVAGWAIEYFFSAVAGNFVDKSPEQLQNSFLSFISSGWMPIFFSLLFVVATGVVVDKGVQRGLERYNKVLMPLMVAILLGLVVNSVFLDGFGQGVAFLFRPDFSKISWHVFMQAVGQSFFSMSLGVGCMITYGSYLKRGENMFRVAGSVALVDLCIALVAGLVIFPAVFTYNIELTSGPDLLFLALPTIFAQMPGGYFVGILFFLLLIAASITSSMSLFEVVVAYLCEELHTTRRRAVMLTGGAVGVMASLCAISQMPDSVLLIGGVNMFDLLNTISATYTMPLGSLLVMIFAGWLFDKDRYIKEVTSNNKYGRRLVPLLRFLVCFVLPVAIALMFLVNIGLGK